MPKHARETTYSADAIRERVFKVLSAVKDRAGIDIEIITILPQEIPSEATVIRIESKLKGASNTIDLEVRPDGVLLPIAWVPTVAGTRTIRIPEGIGAAGNIFEDRFEEVLLRTIEKASAPILRRRR